MRTESIRTAEQVVALELEIDLRLLDLLGITEGLERSDCEVLWALLRAAYGRGYDDAVREGGALQRVPRR